jgi:hypothetical protein
MHRGGNTFQILRSVAFVRRLLHHTVGAWGNALFCAGRPQGAMMKYFTALLIAATVSACSTRYQEMGFTGGVEAQPVMTDVYRIVARGNGYTGQATVQDFVLLKAAETTIEAGGSHFLVLDASNQTSVSVGQTPGSVQTNVYGRTAFTTYTPGVTYNISKPGQDTMIRVLRLKPGENPPQGAFPAHDIVQTIGPRLRSA